MYKFGIHSIRFAYYTHMSDMGLVFKTIENDYITHLKFCGFKRFPDSTISLGTSGQIYFVITKHVFYKTGAIKTLFRSAACKMIWSTQIFFRKTDDISSFNRCKSAV